MMVEYIKKHLGKKTAKVCVIGVMQFKQSGKAGPSSAGSIHHRPEHPPSHIQLNRKMYTVVGDARGGFSGGTIASGLTLISRETASELTSLSSDAYYLARLAPGGGRIGTSKPAPMAPTFIEPDGKWAGPFVMEG